jgi:hypothetical protein
LVAPPSFRRGSPSDGGSTGLGQFDSDDAFYIIYPQKNILWFDIGVDDVTVFVHILESDEHLGGDLLYEGDRDGLISIPANQTKEVFSKHFEYHADVDSIGALMPEAVQKGDHKPSTWLDIQ